MHCGTGAVQRVPTPAAPLQQQLLATGTLPRSGGGSVKTLTPSSSVGSKTIAMQQPGDGTPTTQDTSRIVTPTTPVQRPWAGIVPAVQQQQGPQQPQLQHQQQQLRKASWLPRSGSAVSDGSSGTSGSVIRLRRPFKSPKMKPPDNMSSASATEDREIFPAVNLAQPATCVPIPRRLLTTGQNHGEYRDQCFTGDGENGQHHSTKSASVGHAESNRKESRPGVGRATI